MKSELLEVAQHPEVKNATYEKVRAASIADPMKFLGEWQALINEQASEGQTDAVLALFNLRIKQIDSWDKRLCLSRHDDVSCDLNAALVNGHAELVEKALQVNLAPTDFQELFENENADASLREIIVTTWTIFDDVECDEYLSEIGWSSSSGS